MTDGSQEGIEDWNALGSTAEILERVESRERNLVAVEGDLIVGYISFKRSSHLSLLFVRDGHKRKGIGRHLFLTAIRDLSEVTLNSSDVAVPFYLNLGFQQTGERFLKRGAWLTPMKLCIPA